MFQISVGLSTPGSLAADQFHMLTMVVDQSKVHFYRNTDYLGAVDLPRPVTDCFNDGEGLLVGESGMDLSLVRSAFPAHSPAPSVLTALLLLSLMPPLLALSCLLPVRF